MTPVEDAIAWSICQRVYCIAIVGAAIYALVVMVRLAQRQQMLTYIRTGNRPVRAR
jgi:isoprenylcysteine carboxyl methyltransferase (ICMT) family protein YpbQ